MTLTAETLWNSIVEKKNYSRYETRDGRVFLGIPASQVPAALRDAGWKNVSRLDWMDIRDMGLEIVEAQYIQGARPTGKFVYTVVID
jgi:hypothetical protein